MLADFIVATLLEDRYIDVFDLVISSFERVLLIYLRASPPDGETILYKRDIGHLFLSFCMDVLLLSLKKYKSRGDGIPNSPVTTGVELVPTYTSL